MPRQCSENITEDFFQCRNNATQKSPDLSVPKQCNVQSTEDLSVPRQCNENSTED